MKNEPITTVEIVIHTEFGGFHLDMEMALWLMENRNWKVTKKWEERENFQLIESFGDFHPTDDSINFRMNKDLIDCVRAIKEVHKDDKYPESYYGHIHKLEIVKMAVYIGVENYHDGKEKVNCHVEEL